MVRLWLFSGRELLAVVVIGLLSPLINDRIENALFGSLFGIPAFFNLSNNLYASTGGPIFGDLLQTWFQYGAVWVAFLVRKPGAATIAMTINGFGQVFFNGTHSAHLLYGVAGIGPDLIFGLFRYKRYDVLAVCLSGIASGLFWYPVVYFSHAVYMYPPLFILTDLVMRVLGSAVGNGLLGAALGLATLWVTHRFRKPAHEISTAHTVNLHGQIGFLDPSERPTHTTLTITERRSKPCHELNSTKERIKSQTSVSRKRNSAQALSAIGRPRKWKSTGSGTSANSRL